MHTFKKGNIVTVYNQTWGGSFIIEGKATILRPIRGVDEQYLVRFMRHGKPSLGEEYERFIDPLGQNEPQAYLTKLNAPRIRELET
jgi:hypothetical protein